MCAVHSGCGAPTSRPVYGDVRVVPLQGTTVATRECDDVHFGGVELFFQGQWGRICSAIHSGIDLDAEFTLDAHVSCRQLRFPFGTVMDANDRIFEDGDTEGVVTWASEVQNRKHDT